jgi:uncharacterized membrane protein
MVAVLCTLAAHHDRRHVGGVVVVPQLCADSDRAQNRAGRDRTVITRFIAPNVLFWFRYSALATVIFGLILAWSKDYLVQALTLQRPAYAIGIGMWLALIMAFNVWFVIWPNQKKILGLVEASADKKAAAGRVAGMTSRVNTMFSIPMLYCMVAEQNAGL